MPQTPEAQARMEIDRLLTASGWQDCDVKIADVPDTRGVALHESQLAETYGTADYLLRFDQKAVGVVESDHSGGQLYTDPHPHLIRELVEVFTPFKGRVNDLRCGSGGMLAQTETIIEAHAGKLRDTSIHRGNCSYTTWPQAEIARASRWIGSNQTRFA